MSEPIRLETVIHAARELQDQVFELKKKCESLEAQLSVAKDCLQFILGDKYARHITFKYIDKSVGEKVQETLDDMAKIEGST